MSDMRNVSEEQRQQFLKDINQEFTRLEKKYGPDVVRWAVNKLTEQRRERQRIQEQREKLDAELAELNRKAAAL